MLFQEENPEETLRLMLKGVPDRLRSEVPCEDASHAIRETEVPTGFHIVVLCHAMPSLDPSDFRSELLRGLE